MPMILYTFLDEHDLSRKTVVPFNTSGGSGFSGSLDTIAQALTANNEADIQPWLQELGLL